jgi:hypothetical protein
MFKSSPKLSRMEQESIKCFTNVVLVINIYLKYKFLKSKVVSYVNDLSFLKFVFLFKWLID